MLLGFSALKEILPQLQHLQSIELLLVEGPPNLSPNTQEIQGIVSSFRDDCLSLKHMVAMCE